MRKIYVLYGWTPKHGDYVSGIFSSKRKAEHAKSVLESKWKGERIYSIQTEVLL